MTKSVQHPTIHKARILCEDCTIPQLKRSESTSSSGESTREAAAVAVQTQIIRPAPLKKYPTANVALVSNGCNSGNTNNTANGVEQKIKNKPRIQQKQDSQIDFPIVMDSPNNEQQRNIPVATSSSTKNYRVAYHPRKSNMKKRETSPNNTNTTPLFERIHTEEVEELKVYQRVIDTKNMQISELEIVHDDLETRLECETRSRMELEKKLDSQTNYWMGERKELEKEVELWKSKVMMEKNKNMKLLEEINKKDKEIHKMMQRKYDAQTHSTNQQPKREQARSNNLQRSNSQSRSLHSVNYLKSPQEILAASGSAQTVRERNVANSLLDFFGM